MNSRKGSGSSQYRPNHDQLNRQMADARIDPPQEGGWEVIGKKNKNRAGSDAAKSGNSNWPQASDQRRPVGRGTLRPQAPKQSWEAPYMAPRPAIPATPLQNGWQWAARGASPGFQQNGKKENTSTAVSTEESVVGYGSDPETEAKQPDIDSEDDLAEDSDDDLSDDYDSDMSQKSHETRKNNRWFKVFFKTLDDLSVEEINEQSRQWHCPACHNGPGAIDWYKGLQPLVSHAKTKGSTRVKLHRELAMLLEDELRRRGTSVVPAGEAFGKWKGLRDPTTDREIVWPPMVVVMNTLLEKDDNDKWIGMGNQELMDYFSEYAATRAKHSYGPRGHRGMSLLIFEPTTVGYHEAERLHNHFTEEGRDRDAWDRRKVLFGPGGKRQLYGYLASKEDMDNFNHHSHGKTRVRFDIKSYQEMVVIPMKKMSQDNQQLIYYKNTANKHQQRSKALEESIGQLGEKLRVTTEEVIIVRLRTKIQYEENKEQLDYLENFNKESLAIIRNDIEKKERAFEKQLQEERAKAVEFKSNHGTKEDLRVRLEETSRFIDSQEKGVEEFVIKRDKLIKEHEDSKVELRRKYLEEEVNLEKKFDAALTELMEQHAPTTFQASSK